MRTQKIITAAMMCFITVKLNAQQAEVSNNQMKVSEKHPSFQMNIVPDEIPSAFGLRIQNPEEKQLKLQISHKVFGPILDTVISSKDFSRRYNMKEVSDGRYRIILKNGKEKCLSEIELNSVVSKSLIFY